jgi:DNA-3-methyladenine glycosylase I
MVDEIRCPWATREPEKTYHDTEWGVPEHADSRLFELLTLEGAQAGLSWETILRKRDGYRRVFHGFDPAVVAAFDDGAIEAAVNDPGIVRHRGKIVSTVTNARALASVRRECGSFDAYIWAFVGGTPVIGGHRMTDELPGTTPLAVAVSRDLKKRAFTFVGATTVLAFLQAAGIVNDHRRECFRFAELTESSGARAGLG